MFARRRLKGSDFLRKCAELKLLRTKENTEEKKYKEVKRERNALYLTLEKDYEAQIVLKTKLSENPKTTSIIMRALQTKLQR